MGKASLSDEVSPTRPTAKLGVVDATTMQKFARDYRVLYAMALELDHYPPIPMPDALESAARPCARMVRDMAQRFSDVVGELADSLEDGRVTNTELRDVQAAWGALVQAGQSVMAQLQAMNAALQELAPGAGS